ncbi:MAG: hypothetical protein ACK4FJ_03945 [Ferrovibrio sp.]|uniref:hypothetical protein n=1 Tax=Ferrovibrio sp. TaxID=1917215 RepID=UPI003918DECF
MSEDFAIASLPSAGMQPKPQAKQAEAVGDGEARERRGMFGSGGFKFADFLDIINPLQHIPIVSTIYRAITGDQIEAGSRMAGGALFGGPIGLAVSVVSAMVNESTGKDPGEHAMAMLGIDLGGKEQPATAVAENDAAPTGQPAEQEAAQQQAAMIQAQMQAPRPDMRPDLRLAARMDDRRNEQQPELGKSADAKSAIELPSDLFQALKQQAAAQAVPVGPALEAIAAAQARNPLAAARGRTQPTIVNSSAPEMVDGRTWFPAFPSNAPAPGRAVGSSPITQQNVATKYDAKLSSQQLHGQPPSNNDWANRAAEAYQKYFDMQQQRDRQRPAQPALDATY